MSSEVDICNQALAELGAQPIVALTDATDKARFCNKFYTPARDWLLRKYDWNFASNKATLTRLTDSPAFDYDYAYQLPTLPYCLAVREMQQQRPSEGGYDYNIASRTLETNAATVLIRYTGKITDTTSFDALFEEALVKLLKVKLITALGKSASDRELALKEFQAAIEEAEEGDAIEGYAASLETGARQEDDGDWLSDR